MDKLQCEQNCIHCPVCGHKEQFKEYFKQHIALRKESILFDSQPTCKFYLNENDVERKHSRDISDIYDKVKEVTGKEPTVIGSKDDLNKLHKKDNNKSDTFEELYNKLIDDCNIESDKSYIEYIKGLKENAKEQIDYLKNKQLENKRNLVKLKSMLTGKLKEKQLILEHIKMLDNFVKCGFGVSEDELNRLTKEREKIQKEVKTIESEIDMVKTNMELYNECFNNDECTVTKDEDEIDKFWNEFINNSNWKAYRINQISKY